MEAIIPSKIYMKCGSSVCGSNMVEAAVWKIFPFNFLSSNEFFLRSYIVFICYLKEICIIFAHKVGISEETLIWRLFSDIKLLDSINAGLKLSSGG